MRLPEDAALVFSTGMPTARASKLRYYKLPEFARRVQIPPPEASDRLREVEGIAPEANHRGKSVSPAPDSQRLSKIGSGHFRLCEAPVKPRITVYLSDGQLDYLRREAAKRRRSLSSYVTDCLLDYHVEAAPVPKTSTESSPPFSALLRDTEEHIAAEIEKRTSGASTQLSKQLMVLTAMFDRFVLSNLVHTPEVPEANRSNAISSGERRYANWREAVKEVLDQLGASPPEAWLQNGRAEMREEDAA